MGLQRRGHGQAGIVVNDQRARVVTARQGIAHRIADIAARQEDLIVAFRQGLEHEAGAAIGVVIAGSDRVEVLVGELFVQADGAAVEITAVQILVEGEIDRQVARLGAGRRRYVDDRRTGGVEGEVLAVIQHGFASLVVDTGQTERIQPVITGETSNIETQAAVAQHLDTRGHRRHGGAGKRQIAGLDAGEIDAFGESDFKENRL